MNHAIPAVVLKQHIAVLGKTGSGKTSTEKLAVEQVAAEGARVCVLDTVKSDWWGITSSASGKRAGLPFKILGGPRGHVPLHSNAGKVIGQLVATGKLPLSIIDMADFDAGGVQRFFVDFAQALFRNMRGVVYLVMEEAHEVAPKERAGFGAENMSIHWAKKLATAGRSKGIRLIVSSQSVQQLHNRVLGACETLIAHRLTTPADQKPVLDWLKANAKPGIIEMVSAQLSSIKTGSGWICSGEAQIFERRDFPKFKTFDNSKTPDGEIADMDVTTAPVDQNELRAIIGDAVKQAEADDPAHLKAEIVKLKRDLAAKPVAAAADPTALKKAEDAAYARGEAETAPIWFRRGVEETVKEIGNQVGSLQLPAFINKQLAIYRHIGAIPKMQPVVSKTNGHAKPAPRPVVRQETGGTKLPRAERRILTALAQYPDGRSKTQAAILSGYASNGGGFKNALSAMRTSGFITNSGDHYRITDAGLEALGSFDLLPTGSALLDHWFGQLAKAERAILRSLAGSYPSPLTREDVAAQAGYEPDGGGFKNALSKLRTLELISGTGELKASDDLFG